MVRKTIHDLLSPEPTGRGPVKCLCGRFATFAGERSYFNGSIKYEESDSGSG